MEWSQKNEKKKYKMIGKKGQGKGKNREEKRKGGI